MSIQVHTTEFIEAVRETLQKVEPGFYMTREQICLKLGLDTEHANDISTLFRKGVFPEFETVKSRGIRRRKVDPKVPAVVQVPVAPQE